MSARSYRRLPVVFPFPCAETYLSCQPDATLRRNFIACGRLWGGVPGSLASQEHAPGADACNAAPITAASPDASQEETGAQRMRVSLLTILARL